MNIWNLIADGYGYEDELDLDELIEWAKDYEMSTEEIEEQRVGFAYGNAKLHNDSITRKDIIAASKRMKDD